MNMEKFTHAKLLNLPFLLLFILHTSLARPVQIDNCFITFFTNGVLENSRSSYVQLTLKTNPNEHAHGWLPFLSSVQALESGNLTVIEEEMKGTLKGKLQGFYVTSSEDDSSRLVVMRVVFGSGRPADSLRFFGEYRPGLSESHIAVVGGTGKYHGANGFVVVKATGQEIWVGRRKKKKLVFTVYIK